MTQTKDSRELESLSDLKRMVDPQRGEMLICYGGMDPEEVETMLECAAAQSRIFWLEEDAPKLTPPLMAAVKEGRLAASRVDGETHRIFFDLFDPKQDLAFVILNAGRASDAAQTGCVEMLRSLREQMQRDIFNAGTLVTKGPLWQRNTLQNLPIILRSPGLAALDGAFCGCPAVVVGAGPSLNDTLLWLQDLQDQFIIISTGTALKPLTQAGISPDLVIAVDGSHLIAHQFTEPCDELYLAGSTLVYPGIPARFKGCFFGLLDANPIDQWIRRISNIDGPLFAGGTVTACGMDLAARMECDPIITVGLDLAYSDDGNSHADGTMYHGVKRGQNELIPVPGNWQETVYTTPQFNRYIDLVEQYVKHKPDIQFYNLTSGGAKIRGMKLGQLDSLRQLAGEKMDARGVIDALYGESLTGCATNVLKHLNEVVEYLDSVQNHCREGAMLSNRLLLMLRSPQRTDPEEMDFCLKRLQEVDEALDSEGKEYDFLKMSLWPAAYGLSMQAREYEKDCAEDEKALSRSRQFYEQVAGASKWTRRLVLHACAELECQT